MRLIIHNHLPRRRTHDQGRSSLAQGPGRVEVVELPQSTGKTLYGAHIYGGGFGGYVLGHGYKSREEAKRDGERFLKQHGETDDAARTSLKAGDRVKHFVSGDLGTIGSFASGYAVVTWDRGGTTSLVAPEILVAVGTDDAKGDTVQIVYARAEETALEPTGRYVERDRNLFPEFKVAWEGKAGLWKHQGTQEDVQKAKAWAAGEGYEVFTYPMSESDPKGKAKAAVVAKAKRR